jgi:hypothetical protein
LTQQGAMKELRQSSKVTGIFTNITQENINAADDLVAPPDAGELLPGDPSAPGVPPMPGAKPALGKPGVKKPDNLNLPGDKNAEVRPQSQAPKLDAGKTRRVQLQQ